MVFKRFGRAHGEYQGRSHAEQGLKRRPSPSLGFSVLSKGYMNAFFTSYDDSFRKQEAVHRQRAQRLAANGAPEARNYDPKKEQEDFDRGWHEAFEGKAMSPDKPSAAFSRGYQLGQRDRDFQRAKELRDRLTKEQKRQSLQSELSR